MSGQLHTMAAIPLAQGSLVATEQEAGWTPDPFCLYREEIKLWSLLYSPQATHCTKCAVPF
jgi:hypothetical protein